MKLLAGLLSITTLSLSACGQPGPDDGTQSEPARPQILSAAHVGPAVPGEPSPAGRMIIGRGKDYTPIAEDPAQLFQRLESSMADRRAIGWKIVAAMLEPQKLTLNGQTFEVPLWHTWYEGMSANPELMNKIDLYIANLARCKDDPGCTKSKEQIAHETVGADQAGNRKDLVASLTNANLNQRLRQFGEIANSGGDELGQGFTLFSPSFVEHLLTQAQGVEACTGNRVAWSVPPPSASQFSPCMTEFPRSSVMVKAADRDARGRNRAKDRCCRNDGDAFFGNVAGNFGLARKSGKDVLNPDARRDDVRSQCHPFFDQGYARVDLDQPLVGARRKFRLWPRSASVDREVQRRHVEQLQNVRHNRVR